MNSKNHKGLGSIEALAIGLFFQECKEKDVSRSWTDLDEKEKNYFRQIAEMRIRTIVRRTELRTINIAMKAGMKNSPGNGGGNK